MLASGVAIFAILILDFFGDWAKRRCRYLLLVDLYRRDSPSPVIPSSVSISTNTQGNRGQCLPLTAYVHVRYLKFTLLLAAAAV